MKKRVHFKNFTDKYECTWIAGIPKRALQARRTILTRRTIIASLSFPSFESIQSRVAFQTLEACTETKQEIGIGLALVM